MCAFSDGPSSQFKNRYLVNFLHKLQKIVNIEWNFFATSYDKGVVDGIGATVKRLVWNAVMTRAAPVVQDAQSFYTVASTLPMAVIVSFVSKKERDDVLSSLSMEKCFSEATPIPGISKFHCIQPTEDGFVNCRLYSSQLTSQSDEPPHVFPYDSDLESSCSEVVTSDNDCDDRCSDDEDCNENEEEENVDEEENGSDIVELEIDSRNSDGEDNVASKKEIPKKKVSVKLGMIDDLLNPLNQPSVDYFLPQYKINEVEAVLSGLIKFKGSNLINLDELKSLTNFDAVNAQDKWLTNFVIYDYTSLIKSSSHLNVKAISWEIFETNTSCSIAKNLQDSSFSTLDLVVVPLNKRRIEHWSILVVLPKMKIAAILDSNYAILDSKF